MNGSWGKKRNLRQSLLCVVYIYKISEASAREFYQRQLFLRCFSPLSVFIDLAAQSMATFFFLRVCVILESRQFERAPRILARKPFGKF